MRCYFHIFYSCRVHPDTEGIEFDDLSSLMAEVKSAVAELEAEGEIPPGSCLLLNIPEMKITLAIQSQN